MIRLLLLLLTLSFSTVFTFIPDIELERYKPYNYQGEVIMIDTWALPLEEGFKDFFVFSDQRLTLETHLFFLFEHLILVTLAVVVWMQEREFRTAAVVYLILQALDTLIYVLAYGKLQFPHIPISWNFIKIIVFVMAIVYERKQLG